MMCPRCTHPIPDAPPLRRDYVTDDAFAEARAGWRATQKGRPGCRCPRCPICWDLVVKGVCPCKAYRFLQHALKQPRVKKRA